LINADLTIICEAPKIGPHRSKMQASIAEMLKVNPSRISIKATTTEQLGFTGRGEGIAAQAVVSIALPMRTQE
jgi:2-C-methyl-D-erythritol 4-phosphate cytidylyltransferase/2-C-methyl-D-erythritol 2,4-cyclodiphosphate synthase